MKTLTILALAGSLTIPMLAQPQPTVITDPRGPSVRVTVDHLEFSAASADHISFKLYTRIGSFRNAKVKRVRFEGMYLGEIPFFIDPLEEKMQLKAGEDVAAPPVPVTVYFRDLDSLKTLEDAVREGEVHVSGRARVEIDLGALERLGVGQWNGLADVILSGNLPVTIPGGDIGKTAALLAIRGAEKAIPTASAKVTEMTGHGPFKAKDMNDAFRPWLVVGESKYSVVSASGKRIDYKDIWLGVRVSDDMVVMPAEAVEPWKYNPDMALILQNGGTVVDEAHELTLHYDGLTGDAPSLSGGTLKVERIMSAKESMLVQDDDKRVRVDMSKRESNSNYALLRIANTDNASGKTPVFSNQPRQASLDHVGVFHVTPGGKLEVVLLSAHEHDGRIVLDSPVDDSAFGSIVVAADGIVGMVQDERSAMFLQEDLLKTRNPSGAGKRGM